METGKNNIKKELKKNKTIKNQKTEKEKMRSLFFLFLVVTAASAELLFYPIDVEKKFNEASSEWQVKLTNTMHKPMFLNLHEDHTMELRFMEPIYLRIEESKSDISWTFYQHWHSSESNQIFKTKLLEQSTTLSPVDMLSSAFWFLEASCLEMEHPLSERDKINLKRDFYDISIRTIEKIPLEDIPTFHMTVNLVVVDKCLGSVIPEIDLFSHIEKYVQKMMEFFMDQNKKEI